MNDKPAMANTQAFAVITQDELSSLRAELAELRARVNATKISIPTATMEQEFAWHYRKGFEAGKSAPAAVAKDAMLIYEKALVKLATLGNEPLLGNSSGNVIAQDALAQAAAILAAKEKGQ